jgi:hypothetical protein
MADRLTPSFNRQDQFDSITKQTLRRGLINPPKFLVSDRLNQINSATNKRNLAGRREDASRRHS